ncbi:hypothetical protein NP493_494g04031 [Ridgeia piscesae]|uniref:Non-haem dioxygenase N-terminal domain-containing protein n=1 Tax=Ridgeia piscesae TaxID=27915 RepID=A0AAD9KYZ8_RIDPI|nr:hypothetical protein NP493_494g04031 [Ridgeia piscesae]
MSAKTVVQIPVVDLAEFNVTKNAEDASEQVIRQLAAEICQAFGTVGFVSLRNHGILIDKIRRLVGEAGKFFNLPETRKMKYSRPEDKNGGWVCKERER